MARLESEDVKTREDLDGWFMNRGEAVPTQPTWGLVAEILDMAKIHE